MIWKIDNAHSRALFSVRHMMIANVHGQFREISGEVDFDPENPAETSVDIKIAAESIDTQEPDRDAHLKSADFLNAEKYPYLYFRSDRVEVLDEKRAKLYGDLIIRDITRPVVLEVEYTGMAKSPWGTTVAGFTAKTEINRKDWDLTWNVALETGGFLVGDRIKINIELEIVNEAEKEAARSVQA